jgi:hypothetical protein
VVASPMPVRNIQFPYKQDRVETVERAIGRQGAVARLTRNPLAEFMFKICDKVLSYRAARIVIEDVGCSFHSE